MTAYTWGRVTGRALWIGSVGAFVLLGADSWELAAAATMAVAYVGRPGGWHRDASEVRDA